MLEGFEKAVRLIDKLPNKWDFPSELNMHANRVVKPPIPIFVFCFILSLVFCNSCSNNKSKQAKEGRENTQADTTTTSRDASAIYQSVASSTVTVVGDKSFGSGFFVERDLVATNFHVVEGQTKIRVYLGSSEEPIPVKGYVSVDKVNDIIVLQLDYQRGIPIKLSKDTPSPGSLVYVIGTPMGLPASISDGIVSGLREFDGRKLIQISAPISPGSSGGPVLSEKGEVIGISRLTLTQGQNLNFAIPVKLLEAMLDFKSTGPRSLSSLNIQPREQTSSFTEHPRKKPSEDVDTSAITYLFSRVAYAGAPIRDSPSSHYRVIYKVPREHVVYVIEFCENPSYCFVYCDGKKGYMLFEDLTQESPDWR